MRLTEVELPHEDFLERGYISKGEIRKSFDVYKLEETAEYSTQSLQMWGIASSNLR